MSLDPCIVQKSLDERLTEYSCIFSYSGKVISAPEVKNVWCDYVELTLKNTGQWQALWKIPLVDCENLNIDFPTVAFVDVRELNCNELSALVTIVAIERDVVLPGEHEAMLIHLHPTIQQTNKSLDVKDIVQCLDNLRFFYYHIWQSWDDEDEKSRDWVTDCLEPRMKLFRDMQDGVLSPFTVSLFKRLLQEAKSLHKHKSFLEMEYQNILSKKSLKAEFFDDPKEKNIALELMECKLKWKQILQEIEMMENPLLRKSVIERHQKGQKSPSCSAHSEHYYIVWKGGSYKELLDLMHKAQTRVPENAKVKHCNLKTALNFMDENDTLFLCEGTHKINDEMIFKRNGTIKGFPTSSEVILSSEVPCSILINWEGSKFMLSDLSISAQVSHALLVVCCGVMNLKSCHLICDSERDSVTGVCILPGGVAEMINCDLTGFDVGLKVHAGAEVRLVCCRITSCAIGIQVFDGAEVYLKDSIVQNCSEYGFVFRTIQNNVPDTIGSLKIFESCESVVVENSKMQGNARGDVIISTIASLNSPPCDINMETETSSVTYNSDAELENSLNP